MDVSASLGELILAVEGKRLPQTEVPDTAMASLGSTSGLVAQVVAGGGTPSAELVRQLKLESERFAKGFLLPNIRLGARIQQKGDEAGINYTQTRRQVSQDLVKMLELMGALVKRTPFDLRRVRSLALKEPSSRLNKTTELSFPPDKASTYALQVLAGVSAVEAMSRPVDIYVRLRITTEDSFPEGLRVAQTSTSGGFVTGFEVLSNAGAIDPRTLRVSIGDLVQWLGGTATIESIGATQITLANSTIATDSRPVVTIESNPAAAYREMRADIKAQLPLIPSPRKLEEQLTVLDSPDLARIREFARFLGQSAAQLHPLDDEVLLTLERLDVDLDPVSQTFSDVLLAYDPPFRSSTKSAALNVLDTLQQDGFDRAEELILTGALNDFFLANVNMASHLNRLGLTSGFLSEAIGLSPPPTVQTR
jgi:hypothetical protein